MGGGRLGGERLGGAVRGERSVLIIENRYELSVASQPGTRPRSGTRRERTRRRLHRLPAPAQSVGPSPATVATGRQGQGVGRRLIAHGLGARPRDGVDTALTYGDPAL